MADPSTFERDGLCVATVDLVLEGGFANLTVPMLCERAGVEQAAFDRHFNSLEECVTETFDVGARRYNDAVFSAFESGESWRESLRAAAYASARFIRDNRRFILFSAVALDNASEFVQAHRDAILQKNVEMIDAGRQELDDPDSISPAVAESVIGSIYTMLGKHLASGGAEDPEEFVPELMYIAVRPYLGHQVAREELTIPPPSEWPSDA
jgi:AcrR family transcriptional regulator